MKYKYCKDCIRVKMSRSEYDALVRLVSLSQKYYYNKSILDACDCAEFVYLLFIKEKFGKNHDHLT